MKWILLWVVISGRGVTNDSVEFNTEGACKKAAAAVKEMVVHYETFNSVCVSKGADK